MADTREAHVLLAAFIPMLMDTGGNAGAQSSTLIIRSLVLGEIKFSDIWRVVFKEFRVSIVVGILLSIINVGRIYIIEKNIFLALTVGLTLFVTIITAKFLGAVLPILAKKVRLDPTIMASPIITTIVDTVALVIYFVFANWMLGLG